MTTVGDVTCPACAAAVPRAMLRPLTAGQRIKAGLTDGRVWALAVAANVAAGVLAAALDLGGVAPTLGANAVVGLYGAQRLGAVAGCPRCGAVGRFAPAAAAPPA